MLGKKKKKKEVAQHEQPEFLESPTAGWVCSLEIFVKVFLDHVQLVNKLLKCVD